MPRAEQLAVVALLDGVERGDTDMEVMLRARRGEAEDKTGPVEFEVRSKKVAG